MPTTENAVENVNGNGNATDNNEVRDQFGRLASERIIELSPEDAEAVNREVEVGKHQAFDDAIHHLLMHGAKELERTRKQQAANRDARKHMAQIKIQEALFAQHPELIADPNVVAKVMAALGIKLPAAR